MEMVTPAVYLVAETKLDAAPIEEYLETIGAPEWESKDPPSDGEELVEFMGRQCYRSFGADLNPNITKVREGNDSYLKNVLGVGHGSIFEHVQYSFVFHNVSRVFTHELVRHRVGVAISQESLRYVRLDALRMWLPPEIASDPEVVEKGMELVGAMEQFQLWLAEHYEIDKAKGRAAFARKKKLTSAFRRFAPIGLATSIGWSANVRTLRHVFEMRTARSAEVEIRVVFHEVVQLMKKRYPNFFGDYEPDYDTEENGYPELGLAEWSTKNRKV